MECVGVRIDLDHAFLTRDDSADERAVVEIRHRLDARVAKPHRVDVARAHVRGMIGGLEEARRVDVGGMVVDRHHLGELRRCCGQRRCEEHRAYLHLLSRVLTFLPSCARPLHDELRSATTCRAALGHYMPSCARPLPTELRSATPCRAALGALRCRLYDDTIVSIVT